MSMAAAITPMDSDEVAANVLTDKYFRGLASELAGEWETLATHLDFRQSEIVKIKMNNHLNVDNQIFDMLVKWRQKLGTVKCSQIELLRQSLRKVKRNDLADQLREMKCPESSSGNHGHTNQEQNQADHGGSTEMSFTYEDPGFKINVQNLKMTGKNNPLFIGTVKDTVFNFKR